MAARLEAMGQAKYAGTTRKSGKRAVWTGHIQLDLNSLSAPAMWRKPRRVFVNSMSDLFHENVPDDFIDLVWGAMAAAPQHTFQILTKRPQRMADLLSRWQRSVLPHVWLGTSVEAAPQMERIDALRRVPAAVRFVSCEPLLGPLNGLRLDGISWAIVGGESGPEARPIEPKWVESIQYACRSAGVAFFFKQWGGRNKKATGRRLHGRTWDEYPRA
jgi:protein gp37